MNKALLFGVDVVERSLAFATTSHTYLMVSSSDFVQLRTILSASLVLDDPQL
ncbi:hypothetical protein MKL26_07055 [Streptococcus suis]|nr:hypothetical protein [Streptococcus suis]